MSEPVNDSSAEAPGRHIELVEDQAQADAQAERSADTHPSPGLTDSKGWDGKLRVDRSALVQNPEALSDPEYSDDENVLPGEQISADEGIYAMQSYDPCRCDHRLTTPQTSLTTKTPKPKTSP